MLASPIPTVFLASSGVTVPMVKALKQILEREGLMVQPWIKPDSFGGYPFTDLLQTAAKCNYAICILWPDDELKRDKKGATHVPRDNVVFEAGLFSGILNKDLWEQSVKDEKRVFYWLNDIHSSILHIPTDLGALNQQRYLFNGDISTVGISELATIIESNAQELGRVILRHWNSTISKRKIQPIEQTFLACFKREWITPPPCPPPLSYKPKALLLDSDDVYDSLVHEACEPDSGIIIVDKDTIWIWDIFPIVLQWRASNVPITIVTSRSSSPEEAKRRELLIGLGCVVIENEIKERLFIVDPGADKNTFVFRFENQKHCCATLINRQLNDADLASIDVRLSELGATLNSTLHVPTILPATDSEIITKLKATNGPRAYKGNAVTMRMEDVPLQNAFSISMSARTYRFRQTSLLAEIFSVNHIPLFEPAAVLLSDGSRSLITPPVVEIHSPDKHIFIEGNTRALHSLCNGLTTIRALVVRGVSTAPPATETQLNAVFLCRLKLPAAWRQLNWDYDAFRNIEAAVHNF